MHCFSIRLEENAATDITELLHDALRGQAGEGIAAVVSSSTVTGLFAAESASAAQALVAEMRSSYPARAAYQSYGVSPMHLAANIRSAAVGNALIWPCADGALLLPAGQRIFAVHFECSAEVEFQVVVK